MKALQPNVLDRESMFIPGAAAVLGHADLDPVGGTVAGSFEPRNLAENLKQDRGVAAFPIVGKSSFGQSEGARSFGPNPCRHCCRQRWVSAFGKLISRRDFQACSAENEDGENLADAGAESGRRRSRGAGREQPPDFARSSARSADGLLPFTRGMSTARM